jgi:hypothetical protein
MSERIDISAYYVPHPGHIEPSVWGENRPNHEGMTFMAEWNGQKAYGVTPFRLDSELDLIGAPAPRNIHLQEERTHGE